MYEGANAIVLDLEVLNSPDDCRHCNRPQDEHMAGDACIGGPACFEKRGWKDRPALGLSIGGYYDYQVGRIIWFDEHNLEAIVSNLENRRPFMVSFNGILFDYVIMRGILRRRAEREGGTRAQELAVLCDRFKAHCATSYDILQEVWAVVGRNTGVSNSLDSLCKANGLGQKTGHGAEAPRQWQQGRYADVLNYCANDIMMTKRFFELICMKRGRIMRDNGPLDIVYPMWTEASHLINRQKQEASPCP